MPSTYMKPTVETSLYWEYTDSTNVKWVLANNRQVAYISPNTGMLADLTVTNSNKQWRDQVARKVAATTAYQKAETLGIPSRLSLTSSEKRSGFSRSDFYQRVWFPNPVNTSIVTFGMEDIVLRDKAVANIKRKLQNRVASVNMLVPIGELRELRKTVTSFAGSATKLVLAMHALRKWKLKEAWKRFGDLWLTWSFGAAPMIADIQNTAAAIKALLRDEKTVNFSTVQEKSWPVTHQLGYQPAANGLEYAGRWSGTATLGYRIVAGHNFNVESANDYEVLEQLGLIPQNIVPALYELTVFSWLADYFTTLGDFVDDTFTGDPRCVYVSLNRRYTVVATLDVFVRPTGLVKLSDWTSHHTQGSYKYFEFARIPQGELPARQLRFKSVDEVGRNTVNRLLNLLSLLGTMRR